MLAQFVMDYSLNGRLHDPIGNRDIHGAVPCGVYPCKGEDRWIALTVFDEERWQALCRALDAEALFGDDRFATAEARRANEDALDIELAALTCERDAAELTRSLQAEGVAAGPVMDARDAYEDEHLRERGMLQRRFQEDTGEVDWIGPYIHASGEAVAIRRPPVRLGQDNDYVYRELLGYSSEDYERLIAEGHVGDRFDDALP